LSNVLMLLDDVKRFLTNCFLLETNEKIAFVE